jgi:hypothetical protein
VYVNAGELIGRHFAVELRKLGALVLYVNDDPTGGPGGRDRRRFDTLKSALPCYDLCAVVRTQNVEEFKALGARRVMRFWMSYDEVAHLPRELTPVEQREYGAEVCFVGTWMPERGPFMARLVDLGVPLSIWGDRWQKAPEWNKLRTAWRGTGVYDETYPKIVSASKVMLGLLSRGNRDLHTQRSLEIPRIGSLFCAERTAEHEELYQDWKEAVFWDDADECAQVCFKLLSDSQARERIRRAGQERVLSLRVGNEDICRQILAEVRIGREPRDCPGKQTE